MVTIIGWCLLGTMKPRRVLEGETQVGRQETVVGKEEMGVTEG